MTEADHPVDDVEVAHARLRPALEFAVAVASEAAQRRLPVPQQLSAFLGQERLPAGALGRVRRAVVGAGEFRAKLGAAADDSVVDELGRVWLARPEGWTERVLLLDRLAAEQERRRNAEAQTQKERKRRQAAEAKADRLESSTGRESRESERLRAQARAAGDAELAATEALAAVRTELADARTAARHAADRGEAADRRRAEIEATVAALRERAVQAESRRDEALAQRAGGGLSASGIADLRHAARRLQQLSGDVSALVDAQPAARTPLALPGSAISDQRAATDFLLRSGATVIVDGYNVAMLGWPTLTLEDQRRQLLGLVDNIVRRFAGPVTVVFDGADVVGASSERRRLARVTYSPAGVTADDVIVHEVEAHPTDRPVVVVTDDHEVRRRTRRLGANQLSSAALLDMGLR